MHDQLVHTTCGKTKKVYTITSWGWAEPSSAKAGAMYFVEISLSLKGSFNGEVSISKSYLKMMLYIEISGLCFELKSKVQL